MTLTLTPEAAHGEWLFMDTIRDRSTAIDGRHAMDVTHGARAWSA
jgi:hypothetical protein